MKPLLKPLSLSAFLLLAANTGHAAPMVRATTSTQVNAAMPPRAVAAVSARGVIAMPLLTPEQKRAGVTMGGEGGQWPRWDIAVAPSDPNFLLLPIDVGGLYKSLDGGATWQIAMNGWNARGANGFAIDPRNANHVVGIGGNSLEWGENWGQSPHGLYVSNDKASSWKHVLAVRSGFSGFVAFDPTSFNAAQKICTRVYFMSDGQGLFRSDDGGESWKSIAAEITPGIGGDWTAGGGTPPILRISKRGVVFVSGANGLFRSDDAGKTFAQLYSKPLSGFDLAADGTIFVSGDDKVLSSRDGKIFSALPCVGLDTAGGKPVRNVKVSPADPKRLLAWVAGDNWKWVRFVSHDGGANWKVVKLDSSLSVLPDNVRQGYFTWHPTNPNVAWTLGGDIATKSTDGGQSFKWSNAGYNGVMIGSSFNFATQNPDAVLLGFQDYNGAFTTDGGKTWNYRDLSGKGWGGQCYGAGQSGQFMWYGDAGDGWGNPRKLRASRDGGTTWNFVKAQDGSEVVWNGPDISYTDPKNAAILFASNWRSVDTGATWAKMEACDGVYISAPDGTIYGKKGNALVKSQDSGASWQTVAEVPGGFNDVAIDAKRNRFYLASEDRLKVYDGKFSEAVLPRDQYGNGLRARTIAIDPQQAQIMYTGGSRDTYATFATLARSTDGGATWENLSSGDGPHEISWIRVNPKTGDAWINGQCYGMWRLPRPTKLGAADASKSDAPRARTVVLAQLAPALRPAPQIALRNGDMSAGEATPEGWSEKWGDVTSARDTQTFHSAPASLRVDATGKSGQAFQMFEVPGGGTYTLSGWVKTQGQAKVNVAVQSFAGDWSKNDFNQVKYLQNDFDWQEFSKEVTIPDWAGRFNVTLLVEGNGKAWLDDVTLSRKGGVAAPVAATTIAATTTTTNAATPTTTSAKTGEEVAITNAIADFGGRNFDYAYGADWKLNENLTTGDDAGTGYVQLATTEHGGAGLLLNGANLTPQGQTFLALRARLLDGNKAGALNVNLVRDDANGGGKTVSFDLSKLNAQTFTTIVVPMPEGKFDKVLQVQMQGTNWSAAAQPLKLQVDKLGTTSTDAQANLRAQTAQANDPMNGPAAKAAPDVAAHGFYPDYPQAWMAMHNGFVERSKQGVTKRDINIVFLGDSITQGWNGDGAEIFNKLYAPLGAVNYGIGGDSTRQVLWRVTHGELDGLTPKLVVLKIGTNNLYGDNNSGSDEEIAAGISKIVAAIRVKLPKTRVLLLGVLPRQNDYFSGRARNINAIIAKLDNGQTVRFLDMSAQFQTELGKVKPELYVPDQLHLAKPGYQLWADTMQPMFDAMSK